MRIVCAVMFVIASAGMVLADKPACTGDRHYDGVGCCPAPVECPVVEPVCPDPPPCPTVTCEGGEETTNNYITVNRCPDLPNYIPCRRKADGSVKCPRPRAPKRVLMPEANATR